MTLNTFPCGVGGVYAVPPLSEAGRVGPRQEDEQGAGAQRRPQGRRRADHEVAGGSRQEGCGDAQAQRRAEEPQRPAPGNELEFWT